MNCALSERGTDEALEELWGAFLDLPIRYVDTPELARKAWHIAKQNGLAHLYDCAYLSLSDGIEFWTADQRLANSIKDTDAMIRLL
jgi:predicted nucleic acid-binding protein